MLNIKQQQLFILILAIFQFYKEVKTQQCIQPPVDPNFSLQSYTGIWYEIGKIQTKGGAFFEKNCVCTKIKVEFDDESGYGQVHNICNWKTPQGQLVDVQADLDPRDPSNYGQDGQFYEIFPQFGNKAEYNVLFQGDNYSVEYDCNGQGPLMNYCIHILSSTPVMDQQLFDQLVKQSEDLGLNQFNLPVTKTLQQGCDYNQQYE